MAEFARLFPRSILDSELAIVIRDRTSQLYRAVSEVIAETSAVLSVAGRVGHVELQARDVGLENVANIPIEEWPISAPVQAALDTKWTKDHPIPLSGVETLTDELTARVKTVNGALPDATGNVVVSFGQANFIPKPDRNPADEDVLTWIDGMGWTPLSIDQLLIFSAGERLLPEPSTVSEGQTLAYVDGKWVAQTPAPPTAPILTSPDGHKWRLVVDDTGGLSTIAVP